MVAFNVERAYSIKGGIVSDAYGSIQPIESDCAPMNIQTTPAADIGLPPDTTPYKDVAAGIQQGMPWIQFVHPSTNEYGPGLSSSVVIYDINGRPRLSIVISSYQLWEGAHTLSSTWYGGRLIRCEQTIEFFSYTESGDIGRELAEPIRSVCESTVVVFP